VEREKQVMSLGLLDRVLEQVAPFTREVCLHLMGEPLGHPNFEACLDLCEKHGTLVTLTTNGTLLSSQNQSLLLKPIVRQVNFSIHSFEANFKDQDPSRYMNRIFEFTDQALRVRPELYVNYRLWDLADPVSLTKTNQILRDQIELRYGLKLDPQTINLQKKKSYKIMGRLYLHLDSRFEWPSLNQPIRSEKGYCYALSNHFGVHADGTVVACCLDKEANLALGSIEKQSVTEILNSQRAVKMREGFKSRKLVEELCKRCDYIKRF
jgi:radical SAM protein with 4Fe4S-binding SPASM domain